MKKTLIFLLIVLFAFSFCACSSKDDKSEESKENGKATSDTLNNNEEENDEFAEYLLSTIGIDGIEVEIGEVEGSSAYIVAQIPDYTQIFLAISKESDPKSALEKIINKEDYETIEFTGYAEVTYDEQGNQVIHSEELIKTFVEKELIKAINAATEEEANAQ